MMRRLSNRLLAVALAGSVFAAGFGATAIMAAYTGNDTAAHENSAAITNTECVGCHGQKAFEKSLDLNTYTGHKRHLYSAYLRFTAMSNGCATCHASTDLEQASGATVNKQVDAALCASCHGTFPTTAHSGVDWASKDPRSCTREGCHAAGGDGDPALAHSSAQYVNTYFASSRTYCTKCHGGLDFFAVEETN